MARLSYFAQTRRELMNTIVNLLAEERDGMKFLDLVTNVANATGISINRAQSLIVELVALGKIDVINGVCYARSVSKEVDRGTEGGGD